MGSLTLKEQLVLRGFAPGERVPVSADEKILGVWPWASGRLIPECSRDGALVSLEAGPAAPPGFVPVGPGLSPGLDLSRRAASGVCSQVPTQQPGQGCWAAGHLPGRRQAPEGLEWTHGFFSPLPFASQLLCSAIASTNTWTVLAYLVLRVHLLKN